VIHMSIAIDYRGVRLLGWRRLVGSVLPTRYGGMALHGLTYRWLNKVGLRKLGDLVDKLLHNPVLPSGRAAALHCRR
jgi:hypothetical protein